MKSERRFVYIVTSINRFYELKIEAVFTNQVKADQFIKRREKEETKVNESLRDFSFECVMKPLIEDSVLRKAFSY